MKKNEMRIVFVLFVAFVALSAGGGWYLYSTLQTVQRELPVERISQRPEQSAVITSLSRVKTALEVVMAEPKEGRLEEFTLALDIAYATIQSYNAAAPAETPDDIQALYDEGPDNDPLHAAILGDFDYCDIGAWACRPKRSWRIAG